MSHINLDVLEWALERSLAVTSATVKYLAGVDVEPLELLQLEADLVGMIGEVKVQKRDGLCRLRRAAGLRGVLTKGEGPN